MMRALRSFVKKPKRAASFFGSGALLKFQAYKPKDIKN
jgi:hypothetical protein